MQKETNRSKGEVLLTKSGLDTLRHKLDEITTKRQSIIKKLQDMDDSEKLSEGVLTEHIQTINKSDFEIAEINSVLNKARIIYKKARPAKVVVGCTVELQDGAKKSECYTIVNHVEVDPFAGKISDRSPLGMMLLNKRVGDLIYFTTSKGVQKSFTILSIE